MNHLMKWLTNYKDQFTKIKSNQKRKEREISHKEQIKATSVELWFQGRLVCIFFFFDKTTETETAEKKKKGEGKGEKGRQVNKKVHNILKGKKKNLFVTFLILFNSHIIAVYKSQIKNSICVHCLVIERHDSGKLQFEKEPL